MKKKMAMKSARWVEIGKMKKKMTVKSARWGGDREDDEEEYGGEECEVGVEIGKMKKKMAAKSARWGGDREDEEEDGGEGCEVGWRYG